MSSINKRRSPAIKKITNLLEYIFLWIFDKTMGWMPRRWHRMIARVTATLFDRFFSIRKKALNRSLDMAGPMPGPHDRKQLLRAIYQETTMFGLEMAKLSWARPAEILGAVEVPESSQRVLDEMHALETGFLIACAHQGNWEWMGAWYSLKYGRFGVVYKPMHNPMSERYLQRVRQRFGTVIFSTREKMPRPMLHHLRAGGVLGILSDQDARSGGVFIPFFGKQAATATGLATLAIRLKMPIMPAFCIRTEQNQFQLRIFPPLWPDLAADDKKAEEVRLMTEYNRLVEEAIKLAPAQYFWWHNRWKTQPKASKRKPC